MNISEFSEDIQGLFGKFWESGHKIFKYRYNSFIFFKRHRWTLMSKHPIANNTIFFKRTKIKVTLATQAGEVAASQKLLKILAIHNYDQLCQHCL